MKYNKLKLTVVAMLLSFAAVAQNGRITANFSDVPLSKARLKERGYDQAELFAERTGVDALAIAIGNAHGFYKEAPELRFDILEDVAKEVSVPLVLHGGSGLSDDDFQTTIREGIAKINIFTDIAVFYLHFKV